MFQSDDGTNCLLFAVSCVISFQLAAIALAIVLLFSYETGAQKIVVSVFLLVMSLEVIPVTRSN
jgi:hypothetical protein